MDVSSVNQFDRFSQQAIQQEQGSQPTTARSQRNWDRDGDHESGDRFSPSSSQGPGQSAQNAGTYRVSRVELFTAAASFFLAQIGAPPTNQPAASPSDQPPVSTATTSVSTPAPNVTSSPAAPAQQPTSNSATPSNAGTAATPNTPAGPSSQDPLQALNSALTSLGLSQQDIQAFDQIANFIKAFSPTAFADLVKQFQRLAQQAAQAASVTPILLPATGAITSSSIATPPPVGSPAANGGPVNGISPGGGVQIEELTIRFSGVETQGSTGSAANGSSGSQGASNGSSGGNFQLSAFSLQIEEVKVTLTGDNGQVAQVQTPQQPANANSSGGIQQVASPNTTAA